MTSKGYSQAESIFKQELNINNINPNEIPPISSGVDSSISTSSSNTTESSELQQQNEITQYLLLYANSQKDFFTPDQYRNAYSSLRNWIYSSLDIYKNEFLSILYPVFVHSYIDLIIKGYPSEARELMDEIGPEHEDHFGDDLRLLRGISNTDHLKENELVHLFRNNRWNIRMCAYSFELLMSFLHQLKSILLLSIINQYINIKVTNMRPGLIDEESYAIAFQSEKDTGSVNSTPINTNLFKREDEEDIFLEESTKSKKKEKKKKEKTDDKLPRILSNVPLPSFNESFQFEIKEDLNKCISLSASSLPSICFYTFFNTYQGLNAIDVSKDISLVAGGFNDSSVKLWNIKELSEKKAAAAAAAAAANVNTGTATTTTTNPTPNTGASITTPTKKHQQQQQQQQQNVQTKKKDSEFKTFLGHSGPVYGCSFSPDNQFLLSCSEDTTVRLWSMETMSNLVCYKGHSFPVWDVNFSPYGFYFASASHDRTARLWSTNYTSPLRIFCGHLSDVNCVRFHPNTNYLATGSSDKSARLWECHTGKCVRIFMGHRAPIYSVALSPDGRLLATGGEDASVILWDLATGKKIKKMDGHTKSIYSLDFSADSNILASGSSDCTVRLWDVNKAVLHSIQPTSNTENTTTITTTSSSNKRKTRSKLFSEELLETYPTKQTPVFNVTFSRRNLLLASGSFTIDNKF
eukprot:gene665-824_t